MISHRNQTDDKQIFFYIMKRTLYMKRWWKIPVAEFGIWLFDRWWCDTPYCHPWRMTFYYHHRGYTSSVYSLSIPKWAVPTCCSCVLCTYSSGNYCGDTLSRIVRTDKTSINRYLQCVYGTLSISILTQFLDHSMKEQSMRPAGSVGWASFSIILSKEALT